VKDQVNVTSQQTDGQEFSLYGFPFDCGMYLPVYVASPNNGLNITVDVFVCRDGTPQLFVFGLETATAGVSWIQSCTIAPSSSVYPIAIRVGGAQGFPNVTRSGPPSRPVVDLPAADVVGLLATTLNSGSAGWSDVSKWMQEVMPDGSLNPLNNDKSRKNFLETLLSTMTKALLCNFSTWMSLNQRGELAEVLNSTEAASQVRFSFFSSFFFSTDLLHQLIHTVRSHRPLNPPS
jgi:hypothetical protein